MGSITIHTLQQLDFAHAFHWHAEFENFPGIMFPCHTMEDTVINFGNDTIDFGGNSFSYPKGAYRGDATVQLYEIADWRVIKWLREWQNMLCDTAKYTVALLGETGVSRMLTIYSLDYRKNPVTTEQIFVIPEGDIQVSRSADKGGLVDISVAFKVVGSRTPV